MTTVEERYAVAEAAAEAKRRAKAKRQPLLLIALINALVLGIALTATVDLRRLQTPGGTALRWVQAAVFGDCGDYLMFSVPDQSRADSRSHAQLCRDLRASTSSARDEALKIGLALGATEADGGGERVEITLTRKGVKSRLILRLVKRGGRWRVLRDELTCGSVGCA